MERGFLMVLVAVIVAVLASGCPTFENTYTGTYREVPEQSQRSGDAIEVDFFRFGDNSAAILRFYDRDPITGDPFGEQAFCVWTSAENFEEDARKFRLYINSASSQLGRSQLFGKVVDDETMSISLLDERSGDPLKGIDDLRMHHHRDEPDTECQRPEDFVVNIEFPRDPNTGGLQEMPPSSGYEIEHPVLAVSWVGVQEASRGSGVFAPVTRHAPTVPLGSGLSSNFDPQRHVLKNDRPLSISPPPEIVRMPSGTTNLALGHFVVVDDSATDQAEPGALNEWQFSWDTEREKLVASTLQRATRPRCDPTTNRWGRALLFIEDRFEDLSPEMQSQFIGLDQCGLEGCAGNFFIVDVCAEDDRVLDLVVNKQADNIPRVPLLVTDQFLSADSIPLPRVNPFQPF